MTETTAATPNETRDTKLEIIMGREALNKLANATVLVLGCGGVGSNCCEALARGGICHFVILDKDIIAPSNINRQAIAFHSTVGKRKVDVMEAMIHDINPAATVIKRTEYLLSDNIDEFFASVFEQTAASSTTSSTPSTPSRPSSPLPNMLRTTTFVWLAPWAGPTNSIPSASALPTSSIRYVTP